MKTEKVIKDELKTILIEISNFDFQNIIEINNIGIFNGISGVSLFYYYLHRATGNEEYYKKSFLLFEKAFNNINPLNLNLSFGSSGIMWLLNLFNRYNAFKLDYEDYLLPYDFLLKKRLCEYESDIDPMHGLLSIANYLLTRNTKASTESLIEIINIIDQRKTIFDNGIAWETNNNDPVDKDKKHINFGYAHGLLAILYFISKIKLKNIEIKKCEDLFNRGLKYFLSFKSNDGEMFFPTRLQDTTLTKNPRIAFCYGDLGIACGLSTDKESNSRI